jgi:thiol-disulfide isomerase/thioredoxin
VIYGYFTGEIWSLPAFILNILGIVSGYLYLRFRDVWRLVPFTVGAVFAVFMFFTGWDYWIHRGNFETFTGRIEAYKLQQRIAGTDQYQQRIDNQTFNNKIVLLDFWHTRCGACFQKFPQLQAFYEQHQSDDSIKVYAVNKPLAEDVRKSAFAVIAEEGYSFPVLLPEEEDLAEKLGVAVYPTTFVIDRQGKVVFKGDIEKAVKMVEELKR